MKGRIIKNISNDYTVDTGKKQFICKPRGKFRLESKTPLVGDIVEFDEKNNYITDIYPRSNELIRPSIANIDIAVIVTAVKPTLDTNLLDKTLTIISYNNILPIIYLTKLDLCNSNELNELKDYFNYYQKIGYVVIKEPTELIKTIKNKTVVFTGQTGAGKSTLLNKINPNLELKTDDISIALGRGKHTTRHIELYNIDGTYIADTPGFSKIDLIDMSNKDIRDNMKEMYDNLEYCKYSDCMHISEEGCHVIELVRNNNILKSRYENYLKFLKR